MFGQQGLNTNTVVFNLLLINGLAFLATMVMGQIVVDLCSVQSYPMDAVSYYLGLYMPGSPNFRPWQILTHFFLHADFLHLFFNMYALWMFGSILERFWGPKKFLTYYMITAMGAAACHLGISFWQQQGLNELEQCFADNSIVIGASGAVFGLLLAFGMLFPNTELMLLFVPVPIKAKYFVIGYGAIELFMIFKNNPGDNVAHFAHLGGMLFGFIMIMIWKRDRSKMY